MSGGVVHGSVQIASEANLRVNEKVRGSVSERSKVLMMLMLMLMSSGEHL